MLARWTEVLVRRARTVLVVGVVLFIAALGYGLVIGGGVFGHLGNGGFDDPASQSATELRHEQELFGNKNVDLVALYRSSAHTAADPAFRDEVEQALSEIPDGTTSSVATYWSTKNPGLVSTDKHATQVLISLTGDDQNEMGEMADKVVPALKSGAKTAGLQLDIGGQWAVYKGVNETVSSDL